MDQELAQQVVDFVADETRTRRERLSLDTELANDVGLDGTDALEFMETFVDKFKVDMTGFQFNAHFGPEGVGCFMPLSMLYLGIRRALGKPVPKPIPITIRDLIAAAESHKWPLQYPTKREQPK